MALHRKMSFPLFIKGRISLKMSSHSKPFHWVITSRTAFNHRQLQKFSDNICVYDFSIIKNSVCSSRCMSFDSLNVFDRKMKQSQRDWAANCKDGRVYDYVKDEIGNRLADRVYDVTRKFDVAVELGCGYGNVLKHLTNENVGLVYQCDMSKKMVEQSEVSPSIRTHKLVVDEEFLPFLENSLDLVISNLSFHWVNDLPGAFGHIHSALKPDGVFIASLFGGDTLFELRSSLQLAEMEREGGIAPHISPFTTASDVGDLLNRAGYKMLTIDVDEIKINYPTMFQLLWDLKGMGESNAAWNRKLSLRKDTLIAASAIYKNMYGNENGSVPATFDIIYFIGWKADKSQPQPLERGSATASMKNISNLYKKP